MHIIPRACPIGKFKGRDQLLSADDRLRAEELEEILKGSGDGDGGQLALPETMTELTPTELTALLDRSEAAFARAAWSTRIVQTVPSTTSCQALASQAS